MDKRKDTAVEAILEQLIEAGPTDIASVFARAFELTMQIERERFLGAGHYERTPERRGYANGTKPKRIDTPAGTVNVQVPKTAGHEGEPFYPQSLERGRRSVRAVMLAVAEMYIKVVSTREDETLCAIGSSTMANAVMREFGIESLSSSQVSRAAKLLDEELAAWRDRPLGEIKYLILDARCEKMRHGGIVREAAVLSAIGIGPDERRRVLGVSVALSEAEVHWRLRQENDPPDRSLIFLSPRKPRRPWSARGRIHRLRRPQRPVCCPPRRSGRRDMAELPFVGETIPRIVS